MGMCTENVFIAHCKGGRLIAIGRPRKQSRGCFRGRFRPSVVPPPEFSTLPPWPHDRVRRIRRSSADRSARRGPAQSRFRRFVRRDQAQVVAADKYGRVTVLEVARTIIQIASIPQLGRLAAERHGAVFRQKGRPFDNADASSRVFQRGIFSMALSERTRHSRSSPLSIGHSPMRRGDFSTQPDPNASMTGWI